MRLLLILFTDSLGWRRLLNRCTPDGLDLRPSTSRTFPGFRWRLAAVMRAMRVVAEDGFTCFKSRARGTVDSF